jgi:hypothetical protein
MDITGRSRDPGETERSAEYGHSIAALCRCSYGLPDQDPNLMKNLHAILCQSLLIFERIVKPFESWNNTTFVPGDERERLI